MALNLKLDAATKQVTGTLVPRATEYVPQILMEIPGHGKHPLPLAGFNPATKITPEFQLGGIDWKTVPHGNIPWLQVTAIEGQNPIEEDSINLTPFMPTPPPPSAPRFNVSVKPDGAEWGEVAGWDHHRLMLEWRIPGTQDWFPVPGFKPFRASKARRFLPAMVPWNKIPDGVELRLKVSTVNAHGDEIGVGEGELTGWRMAQENEDERDEREEQNREARVVKESPSKAEWIARILSVLFAILAVGAIIFALLKPKDGLGLGGKGSHNPDPSVTRDAGGKFSGHASDAKYHSDTWTENGDAYTINYNGGGAYPPPYKVRDRESRNESPRPQGLKWPEGFKPTITRFLNPNCDNAVPGTQVPIQEVIPPNTKIEFITPAKWDSDVIMFADESQYKFTVAVNSNGVTNWVAGVKGGVRPEAVKYGFETQASSVPVQFILTAK